MFISYVIVGALGLSMLGCAVTPMLLDSMSKEEREAAGIVWKEDN